MKKIILTLSIAVSLIAHTSFAASKSSTQATSHSHNAGIGIILGEPTGFTAKFWQESNRAIDLGLSYSFDNAFLIYGDYLFHFPQGFGARTQFVSELSPYIGIGGVMFFTSREHSNKVFTDTSTSTFGLGLRIPLGIEWLPRQTPVGIFLEVAPGIGIIPGTFGFVEAGIGIRYYFN